MHSIKLPDMPMGADTYGAAIHNGKVYISADNVLVYSTNEQKWNVLEVPERHFLSTITLVNDHITLIVGFETQMRTNTTSTWYEEESRWKQVLPPMPTGRFCPGIICHANLLLVTGGFAEDTTDVLDLTTMKWTTPEGLNLPIPLYRPHLALCGEYLYLLGGMKLFKGQEDSGLENANSQAWRAKWSDVKQTATPQHSQPQRGVWTRIADLPTLCPTPVSCGGTLYTVGGVTRDGKSISTVYTYITARNQWVSVGDMSVKRAMHCAVPLSSNTIFVAGGFSKDGDNMLMSTELLLL